jgi:hypothetical protein
LEDLNTLVARKLGKGHIQDGWEKVCVIPAYSTSIAAAWEIVEWLFKTEWALNLKSYPIGREWICILTQQGEKNILAEATTAPLAICRAFLKLP